MTFKNPFKKKPTKDSFKLAPRYNALFNRYKYSAKKRGIDFNLLKEHFLMLVTSNCKYCGTEPFQDYKGLKYMGIDRLNNDKGYGMYNVISCCKRCNYAKGSMGYVEFDDWLEQITSYQTTKAKIFDEGNLKAIRRIQTSRYEKSFYGGPVGVQTLYEGTSTVIVDE